MIQTHLYASIAETPVFGSPHKDGHPAFLLHQGSWMGVIEEKGKWLRVISINGEGWVERENAVVRSAGELHILLTDRFGIEYVNSSPMT